MADQQEDNSQKTEQPTQHSQEEARKRGQIPHSREVQHFFVMGTLLMILWFAGPTIWLGIFRTLSQWFCSNLEIGFSSKILKILQDFLLRVLLHVGIIFGGVMAAAVFGMAIQTRLQVSWTLIKPQMSRISLKEGLKRLFSIKGIAEFFKGLLKLILVGVCILFVLRPELYQTNSLSELSIGGLLQASHLLVCKMLLTAVIIMFFLAILDYTYQFFSTLKELRMTRQQVKDEQKNLEIDPVILRRFRERRYALFESRRSMKGVDEATVVITNPMHYAVALKWDAKKMTAPVLVAKGKGEWALKIRNRAREKMVPVVENPPLARVLYRSLKLNQEILPEHYKAVAQVIRYVTGLDKQLNPNVREESTYEN